MKPIITIMGITLLIQARAQRPESGIWFAGNGAVNFSPHWQWHQDAGYRTRGVSAHALQYLYRTGIRYTYNKHWNIAAGIAFFFTQTDFNIDHHEYRREFRLWQEVVQQLPLNERFTRLFRFRAEQRFFKSMPGKSAYTAYRFRLRTGISQQLNDRWTLQLIDEYMQQMTPGKISFDQNRLILSGLYQYKKTTQVQAGYMWLKWPGDHQHILVFTVLKNILVYDTKGE